MKHFLSFALALAFLFSLSACGMYIKQDLDDTWREAYNEGYEDGLSEGESLYGDSGHDESYEDGYEDGYENGRSDGYEEGYREGKSESGDLIPEAVSYARENGGLHPEEAICIIEDFENNSTVYSDTVPSVDEYIEAVHSLYYFYEYFYSR